MTKYKVYIGIFVSLLMSQLAFSQACLSPHNTIMAFNNGQDGNMFDVTSLRDLTIDSVWCNFDAGTIQEVEIWYRVGTVCGNQNNAAGWTKIDSVINLPSAGPNNFTQVPIYIGVFVPANTTVGLYVTRAFTQNVGPYMRYTNGPFGSTACNLYNQNADMQVSYAYGKDYPFGATFNPRIWNGRIFYSCCPDPPAPQLQNAPTQICSNDTLTYSVQPYAFANSYLWNFGSSGTIVGANQDSSTVQVVFNGSIVFDTVCVEMFDSCSSADTCFPITINPPFADAGNDTSICSTTFNLNGNQASGSWSVVGGSGTFANANQYNTSVSGLAPGVNTLRWSVANATCDTIFDEINITVKPIPVAQFNVSNGCDQNGIPFTDNSYALNGNIIGWNWDVDNDGTIDYTTSSFNHVYPGPGTYTATLYATANLGCIDTVQHQVVINPNPVAEFTYDPDCEGSPMSFTDQTTLSSGMLETWEWDFDDGSNLSNAQSPAHVYQVDGLYIVTLTVTSDSGCQDDFSDTVEVFSIPDVDFYSPEKCQNDTVTFLDTSVSVQGAINFWEWDFGDGSPVVNVQDTVHNFPAHGTYSVRLTVATDRGCTNTVVKPQRSFPIPVPDYVQQGVCEEQDVFFTDASSVDTIYGSELVNWNWDFGDGTDKWNERVGHFYQDPGYFTLSLTPYTNYGCTNTTQYEILIRPKPRANAIVLDDKVCADNPISFLDKTFFDYEFDSVGVVSWDWTFGDGLSSEEEHPKHTFRKGGDFPTKMVVETGYGCIDSTQITTVVYHNPEAQFAYDTLEGCAPHCVTFIDESTLATGEDMFYHWTFGDGNSNVADVNPTHCYEVTDGTGLNSFPVMMDVTTPNGCVDTFTLPQKVLVHAQPIADFEISSTDISLLDSVVYLTDYSQGADYWNWDFGDSTFSTMSSPTKHIYNQAGQYIIELTVSDNYGCLDVISKRVNVERHQTFFVPKSFTPNGDGKNDYFEIYGEDLEYVKLWVFDRWGNELFYGENDNARWDGKQNGQVLPIGSYAYVVEYKQVNQIKQKERGNFIISRGNN